MSKRLDFNFQFYQYPYIICNARFLNSSVKITDEFISFYNSFMITRHVRRMIRFFFSKKLAVVKIDRFEKRDGKG